MKIGNYELIYDLAAGGMATVHVARQTGVAGFERLVVIKRVHKHLLVDKEFHDMFRDEARVAALIRHPNVVSVNDVVDNAGELFLVLDYVESVSLSTLQKAAAAQGNRLPPAVVSRILVDTLSGLHAAHEAVDLRGHRLSLVHRDVSPQNIVIGTDGTSRLIDFGVAKATSRVSATKSGEVKGKLAYMSPEQLRRQDLDRRSDVFAAGTVLYEALAGKRLFSGTDEGDILISILMGEIPPLDVDGHELIRPVLERALARDRDERFGTCIEFQQALEAAIPPATARETASIVMQYQGARIEDLRQQLRFRLEGTRPISRRPGEETVKTAATETAPRGMKGRRWVLGGVIGVGLLSVGLMVERAQRWSGSASAKAYPAQADERVTSKDEAPIVAPFRSVGLPAPGIPNLPASAPTGQPSLLASVQAPSTSMAADPKAPTDPPAASSHTNSPSPLTKRRRPPISAPTSTVLRGNPYK